MSMSEWEDTKTRKSLAHERQRAVYLEGVGLKDGGMEINELNIVYETQLKKPLLEFEFYSEWKG